MSPPSIWGPPIWVFLHTLAARIKEEDYNRLIPQLLSLIQRICSLLPCPECSQHATIFLGKIQIKNIPTKKDFINTIYLFHNSVNKRNKKGLYNYTNIDVYKNYNFINVFKNFVRVYNTKGNMSMINESFRREFVVKDLKKWLKHNIISFL